MKYPQNILIAILLLIAQQFYLNSKLLLVVVLFIAAVRIGVSGRDINSGGGLESSN